MHRVRLRTKTRIGLHMLSIAAHTRCTVHVSTNHPRMQMADGMLMAEETPMIPSPREPGCPMQLLSIVLLLCGTWLLLSLAVSSFTAVREPGVLKAGVGGAESGAIDDKYSRREEYRGFTQEFKEKDGYRPDVKIEYVDETGRKLCPKEAFRQLSHRFHGKGSGKMKTEKRMKKLDEEALLKKMSSSDTPLGTVALLQEKQKAQKTPYIVLSGSGKSMTANTLIK
ncbi:PREDICTED: U4/U6.U5 tri-snRNP-associated protein 1-like [Nanorana parkeri]|uniref:U4/U6.U5 tri-snRNP-associated protein 1-like n=1 Tax=Nanorana parkeri TaxID=125878 RepID=UPI000854C006|nr:PREDICTED: U4/U6.U5 tri-snRNP-associated protein 1-like [Nanorana parkeri]